MTWAGPLAPLVARGRVLGLVLVRRGHNVGRERGRARAHELADGREADVGGKGNVLGGGAAAWVTLTLVAAPKGRRGGCAMARTARCSFSRRPALRLARPPPLGVLRKDGQGRGDVATIFLHEA